MHFLPVLLSVILISLVEASTIPRMTELKLNLITSQNKPKNLEEETQELPNDRRKLPLFPRMNKKFLITPKPNKVMETVHLSQPGTRKPVMKKLLFLNNVHKLRKTDEELESRHPVMDHKFNEEQLTVPHNLDSEEKETSREDSSEISAENTDKDDDTYELANKKTADLPKVIEIKEVTHVEIDNFLGIEKNEVLKDGKEFIFVNPEHQTEESAVSAEEMEDFTTEQNFDVSESSRVKRDFRSDNVIEEENLATTLSTYKFTWHDRDHDRDTNLANSLMFKNINA